MKGFKFWSIIEINGKYYPTQIEKTLLKKVWILEHDMKCYAKNNNIKLEDKI